MNTNLQFIVASSPGHYQAAHRLIKAEGGGRQSLGFPTILAYDGDDLVGMCGTRIVNKMILAGPLMVRTDRRRMFTVLRLCEAYEAAMGSMGISSFILSVDRGSVLQRAVERYLPTQKPYATDDNTDFHVWKVRGYVDKGISAGSLGGRESPAAGAV